MSDGWQVTDVLAGIAVAGLLYAQIHLDHVRGRPGVNMRYEKGEFAAYATRKRIEDAAVMFRAEDGTSLPSSASMVLKGEPIGVVVRPGGEPARASVARGARGKVVEVVVSGTNIVERRFHYYIPYDGDPVRLRGPKPWRRRRVRQLTRTGRRP